MNTRQNTTRWLELVLACGALTFTPAIQAGKPVKPPPPPSAPAYVPVSLGGLRSSEGYIQTFAYDLNNAGQVVGSTCLPGYSYPIYLQAFLLNPRDTNGDGNPDTWFADEIQNATGAPGSDGQNDLMTGLGRPAGATWSQALAVNDLGLVVGDCAYHSDAGDGWMKAFILVPKDTDSDNRADCWYQDSDGDGLNDLMVTLGTPPGLPESASATGLNFNNRGQVIGGFSSTDASGTSHYTAFLLTPEDTNGDGIPDLWYREGNVPGANTLMVDLGDFSPLSINDSGQIVGSSAGRAMLRNPDGSLIDLGAPGTERSAVAINNRGQIAINFALENGHAGLLTPLDVNNDGTPDTWFRDLNGDGVNDLILDLGVVQGMKSSFIRGHGLNDAGSVVGESTGGGGRYGAWRQCAAYLWQNGIIQSLTDLTGGAVEFSSVSAINNPGQIVGGSYILLPSR